MSKAHMLHQKLIANFKQLETQYRSPSFAEDAISYRDSDFLKISDFKRVGSHHVTLPPGCRTSLPHCESHEEEFVFVLEGSADLWLDGWIYPMKAMDAVGFPAGTGNCHTVINNSDREARMLVLGERTKKENKWWYPLNPEKKEQYSSNWWTDAPKFQLGPHNGKPGKVQPHELGSERREMIVHAPSLPRSATFSYPDSTETFGAGHRLSTALKLKTLGIWYDELAPGKRSSWPHAHTHEEEFGFIVSGKPKVWMNGYVYDLVEGDGFAFPPNTNINHCVINDSDESVFMIGVGEATEFPDEKIIYPMHPGRNEEMRSKGFLWIDPPQRDFGPHDGSPKPR